METEWEPGFSYVKRKNFLRKTDDALVLNNMMESEFWSVEGSLRGNKCKVPLEYIERTENIYMVNLKRTIMSEIHRFYIAESSYLTFQYFIKTNF